MNAPTLQRHLQPASGSCAGLKSADFADLSAVVQLITGPDGPEIRDRFYHLKRYRACFLGSDLVAFLMSKYSLVREQALRLGQRLEAADFIRHADGEHAFKDEPLFYCICPRLESSPEFDPVLDLHELAELAQVMRGPNGLRRGPRYSRFVRYPNCFSGREAVGWLSQYCGVPRKRAVQIGHAMLRANFVQHLFDEHGFEDAKLLYMFV